MKGKVSKTGYKRTSPDRNNDYNIIPSGRITMQDVDFPVYGVDEYGNAQMMYPGSEYQFPGNQVFELPMAQRGMSTRRVNRILNDNTDLNWVQRLYEPNTPSIQLPGQSGLSTHFMESSDGKVYPTVVQMSDGSLQYLGEAANAYANKTGEYIQFKNDRQAQRFAKSYKKGTGVLKEYGKGGLTQWFAEKWVDVKTGEECGRSGKDKDGRPYPACRPSKRVNETTPKTSSEMSSSEKAKFKREKTSGQRINYNHKRMFGGSLPSYQDRGEVTNDELYYGPELEEALVIGEKSKDYPYANQLDARSREYWRKHYSDKNNPILRGIKRRARVGDKSLYSELESGAKSVLNTAAEYSGLAGSARFVDDPTGNLIGAVQAIENFMLGTNPMASSFLNTEITPEQTEQFFNTVDVAGLVGGALSLSNKAVAKPLARVVDNLGNKYLPNTRKLNPYAENLNNINSSYRVAGLDAAEDFKNTGVLRSANTQPSTFFGNFEVPSRPTGFPSFQKGYADLAYLPKEGGVVFKTDLPTFKRKEINPVTGNRIKGRHYAHRVIDPETGKTMVEIPASDVTMYSADPHWLKGYKQIEVPKSNFKSEIDWAKWNKEIPENKALMQNVKQNGFIDFKGAFQKYPKGPLTKEEIAAYKNSPQYQKVTQEHLDAVNKYGDKWKLGNYMDDALQEAIATNNRSGINPILYGGRNWGTADYITAGIVGTAFPGVMGLHGLVWSPPAVRSKVMSQIGIPGVPGGLSSKDTIIDLTNRDMDYAKVNETKDGQIIIGGEFIEDANNTVRKAKDWINATDTYSDKEYSSKDIQSFYGVEDGKFKVGKVSDFNPNTEIVPRRFSEANISKAILNGNEMRILDDKESPIYQNTPNTGKFILYSPSTKKSQFTYINTGKSGVDKVNKFLKENKDAQYIHLDNGRYEYYGVNEEGLTDRDFQNYYEQDLERKGNPGYNLIIKKQNGGIIGNNEMFDMTNPNIYRAIAPVGTGIGLGASQLQEKKYGGWLEQYQPGGETSTSDNPKGGQQKQPTSWSDYVNPMNWGVYTYDDAGTFNQAFAKARKEEQDEFMWYGNRYNTQLAPQSDQNVVNDNPPPKASDEINIDFNALKKGVSFVESRNGKYMWNPESSATGLYGQRFSEIGDTPLYPGTRENFRDDREAQERVFGIRYNDGLPGSTSLKKDAIDLYREYYPILKNNNIAPTELAALSNFLGRQGTRYYLGYVLRDGRDLSEVFPKLYGNDIAQKNKTPKEYLKLFREAAYAEEVGGEVEEKHPDYSQHDTYSRAWMAARKELGKNKLFKYGGKVMSTCTPNGY